jgi:cytochrome c peroxidase
MKGYNAIMLDDLTCMACHDGSGLISAPPPDDPEGKWVTQEMGRGGLSVKRSHSIVYTVACDRCHSKENAFGLSTLDSGGDPLEETICLEGETTSVLYDDLGDYGEVDVDYTLGECPTTD